MTIEQVNEMDCKQITNYNFNKNNSSFEIWYEALQHYAEMLDEDFERCLITGCGDEYWKMSYDSGMGIRMTLIEGFNE